MSEIIIFIKRDPKKEAERLDMILKAVMPGEWAQPLIDKDKYTRTPNVK